MAIKSSGQLALRDDIQAEIGGASTNISLRVMSSTAGFTTPDAMSEFYGYSSGAFTLVTTDGLVSELGGSGLNGDPFRFSLSMRGDDSDTAHGRVQYTGDQRYIDLKVSLDVLTNDTDLLIYQSTTTSSIGTLIGSVLDNFYDGTMRTVMRGVDTNLGRYFYIRMNISRGSENTNYTRTISVEINSTANLLAEGIYLLQGPFRPTEGQSIRSVYAPFNNALTNMVGGYGRVLLFFYPDNSNSSSAPQFRQDLQLDRIMIGKTGYNDPTSSPNYFGAEAVNGVKMQTAFYNNIIGNTPDTAQQALLQAPWRDIQANTEQAVFNRYNSTTPSGGTGRVYPIRGTWFYYYEASGDGYDDYYGWMRTKNYIPIDTNFGYYQYVMDMDGRSVVNQQEVWWWIDFRHTQP